LSNKYAIAAKHCQTLLLEGVTRSKTHYNDPAAQLRCTIVANWCVARYWCADVYERTLMVQTLGARLRMDVATQLERIFRAGFMRK
jgi:hypothetical protein